MDESQKPVLPRQGFTSSTLVPQGHYVVPDTNAFLHQVSHTVQHHRSRPIADLFASLSDGPSDVSAAGLAAGHRAADGAGRGPSSESAVVQQTQAAHRRRGETRMGLLERGTKVSPPTAELTKLDELTLFRLWLMSPL